MFSVDFALEQETQFLCAPEAVLDISVSFPASASVARLKPVAGRGLNIPKSNSLRTEGLKCTQTYIGMLWTDSFND